MSYYLRNLIPLLHNTQTKLPLNPERLPIPEFSKYCEKKVASKLMEKGWEVYSPIVDRYIDLIAIKEICKTENCNGWNKKTQKCEKCNSNKNKIVQRTIQVKGSRLELKGDKFSYGINHRPKDLIHDATHFFIWLLFNKNHKENYIIIRPNDFVKLRGTGVITNTWRANRGRYHPSANLDVLKPYLNKWNLLLKTFTDNSTKDIIDSQEKQSKWKNPKKSEELWKKHNKTLLKIIPKEFRKIIKRKTPILTHKLRQKKLKQIQTPRINFNTINLTNNLKRFQKELQIDFKLIEKEWQVYKSLLGENKIIILRLRCINCGLSWNIDEKECFYCKTWFPHISRCKTCHRIILEENIRNCPHCQSINKKRCLVCSKSNEGQFLPITFCQKCGKRHHTFDIREIS